MNRKLSFLAAGLALSAVLTGCTSTAGYRTVPGTGTRWTEYGRAGTVTRGTNGAVTRGRTGAVNRGTAGMGTGYIGADGRWHPYTANSDGLPNGTGARIATYPDMY